MNRTEIKKIQTKDVFRLDYGQKHKKITVGDIRYQKVCLALYDFCLILSSYMKFQNTSVELSMHAKDFLLKLITCKELLIYGVTVSVTQAHTELCVCSLCSGCEMICVNSFNIAFWRSLYYYLNTS